VTSANSDNTLKIKFWANQELILDYKSMLTRTSNRSFVDSFNIITL